MEDVSDPWSKLDTAARPRCLLRDSPMIDEESIPASTKIPGEGDVSEMLRHQTWMHADVASRSSWDENSPSGQGRDRHDPFRATRDCRRLQRHRIDLESSGHRVSVAIGPHLEGSRPHE